MKNLKCVLLLTLVLVLLFSSNAFAAQIDPDGINWTTPNPTVRVINGVATCEARLLFAGKSIDATLELKQGSTVIDSWNDTGYGYLLLSGTANVTPGVTYTLTVYGTVNNSSITPASITFTP